MIFNNDRLIELGLSIHPAPEPVGSYVQCVQANGLLFLSGGISVNGDQGIYGKVGQDIDLATAQQAARYALLNRLAVIEKHLGGFDLLTRIVAVNGFVNCTPDFTDHAKVLNGASDLLVELFGPEAAHSRTAVGVASLPLNVAVEISMIVECETDYAG